VKTLCVFVLIVLIAGLVLVSCERTCVEPDPEFMAPLSAVPAEYGDLIAVTSLSDYPGWFQLWYQSEDGTVRIVRANPFTRLMHKETIVLARN